MNVKKGGLLVAFFVEVMVIAVWTPVCAGVTGRKDFTFSRHPGAGRGPYSLSAPSQQYLFY